MENIGGNDMARKNRVNLQTQTQNEEVNRVIQEVKEGMELTKTETAVGFESLNDSLNEDEDEDEDMVQQHEMELVKEMENESDRIWDRGSRDGVIGASGENKDERPPFGSLSSLSENAKLEESNGNNQIPKDEFNETRNELEAKRIEKEEKEKKKLARDLKKETKQRLEKLNNSNEWKFENTVEISRNKETCKYQTVASAEFLGNLLDRKIAIYVGDLQRGWKHNSKNDLVEVKSEKQIKLIL